MSIWTMKTREVAALERVDSFVQYTALLAFLVVALIVFADNPIIAGLILVAIVFVATALYCLWKER